VRMMNSSSVPFHPLLESEPRGPLTEVSMALASTAIPAEGPPAFGVWQTAKHGSGWEYHRFPTWKKGKHH